jgi:hypothetical protein
MPTTEEPEVNGLFDTTFSQISERIIRLAENNNNRIFYLALLTGGSTMAKAVVDSCQGVKDLWAGGDEAKALVLTELFTLLMLSRCYRWIDDKEPDQQKPQESRRPAVLNILLLFGDDSEKAIEDFFNMDAQFKYDLKYKGHLTHLGIFLLAKAGEACGHKSIDWSNVSFPMKSMEPLTRSGAIINSMTIGNPDDINALWECHAQGVQAMVKYHEEQTQL